MGVWIGLNCFIEGLKHKRIIVVLAEHIGYDSPVVEIQDGTQVEFVDSDSLIPFELGDIGQPLFVGAVRMKLAIQKIFSKILRIPGLPGTAPIVVLDGRFNVPGPADAQYPFVIDMDAVVMAQVIIEPSVALVWALHVDFFNRVCKTLILCGPIAQFPGCPFVVGGTGHMEQFA